MQPPTGDARIRHDQPDPDRSFKDARLQELQQLLRTQQERFNAATSGKILPVLFENAKRRSGWLFGRDSPHAGSTCLLRISDEWIGKECAVEIRNASSQ